VPLTSTSKAREDCLSEKVMWAEAYCFVAVLIKSYFKSPEKSCVWFNATSHATTAAASVPPGITVAQPRQRSSASFAHTSNMLGDEAFGMAGRYMVRPRVMEFVALIGWV
jgi:hypothetical protein